MVEFASQSIAEALPLRNRAERRDMDRGNCSDQGRFRAGYFPPGTPFTGNRASCIGHRASGIERALAHRRIAQSEGYCLSLERAGAHASDRLMRDIGPPNNQQPTATATSATPSASRQKVRKREHINQMRW